MEANLKFLKKLVDVVDERATCFENLSRGAESLATILEDTLTLSQEWGARFCAASVENEDIEAVAQNSVDVGDDENINNERLIKEELSRWSGDMVVLGDLCRKWQNDVYHETIEKLLNDGVHSRSRSVELSVVSLDSVAKDFELTKPHENGAQETRATTYSRSMR
ncbi:MAG: hypothetical protein Q9215_007596 [Flavoplaca cf. flavocitrina]